MMTSRTDIASTVRDQKANELVRVLHAGLRGQWAEFDGFSANYLTKKGCRLARSVEPTWRETQIKAIAYDAIDAGY